MASRSIQAALGANDPDGRTCTLGYVQRELGRADYSARRMVQYLRALIADHHFPAPLPAALKGGTLTRDVHQSSKWIRAAVDAWLDGFIPPDGAATIDAQAMASAAIDMDEAARNLRLVGGREFRA